MIYDPVLDLRGQVKSGSYQLLFGLDKPLFQSLGRHRRARQPLYQLAERREVPMQLVSFTAPHRVVRSRLEERAAGRLPKGYSDADWLIYCRLRPGQEPIARPHIIVDSSRDIAPALEKVLRRVRSGR